MKKAVGIFLAVLFACLFLFSLSFADFANYAAPQLEWISNSFPILWEKPRTDILWVMKLFPDYECSDYGDRICCVSRFNNDDLRNRIYLTFFTDDYEEKHDNLWKVSVTIDLHKEEETQDLLRVLWLKDLKPVEWEDSPYAYPDVMLLFFGNKTTKLVIYDQVYKEGNNPYFLAEYYAVR